MLNLSIKYKNQTLEFAVEKSLTIGDLKKEICKKIKVPVIQQELSYLEEGKKKVLGDNKMPLELSPLKDGKQAQIKNLGLQIRWDYVFYIEYGGPLIIFPLLYLIGSQENYTMVQHIALIMAIIHYLKREFETAYVHVFSRESMPLKRVFINSIHYWVFFALCNGVELYLFPSGHTYSEPILAILFVLWAIFEFCNYKCHMILSSFRKTKEKTENEYENAAKKRGIPRGWGFGFVSCANYFWEAMGWITFSILTRSWTAYMFTFYSIYQMLEWAIKKHKNYKREFGDKYPKGRKSMFPFII